MELRKEYAGIVDGHVGGLSDIACERIALVALACQELADRPMKELTDAEIDAIDGKTGSMRQFARAIEAAILAKQREPEVVKFRAARSKRGDVAVYPSDDDLGDSWEWLEPAQEFEVRI